MKKLLPVVAVILLVGVLVYIVFLRPDDPPPDVAPNGDGDSPAPALTVDEKLELIEQKNVALAHLENKETEESSALWSAIAEKLPDSILPVQNRAIGALIAVEDAEPNQKPDALTSAQAAIAALQEKAPDAAATHILAGRLALLENDFSRAVREFEAATEADPDDASAWLELWSVSASTNEELPDSLSAALKRAHELAPQNLWILIPLLLQQADEQNPGIVETIDTAMPLIERLAPGVEQRSNNNPAEFLEQARAAAVDGDWSNVQNRTRLLKNILIAEDALKSDEIRIEKHVLEFVVDRFPDDFYEDLPADSAVAAAPSEVSFQPMAGEGDEIAVEGLVDAVLADFNLDSRLDVCALTNDSIIVFSRDAESGGWEPICSADAPANAAGFRLIDVDDDRIVPLIETMPGGEGVEGESRSDLDLVVFGGEGLALFLNTLDKETREAGLEPADAFADAGSLGPLQHCEVLDVDMDGDLDLLVSGESGTQVLSNRSNSTFELASDAIVDAPDRFTVVDSASVDFDRDVDLDVLCVTTDGEVGLLENLRHQTLRWRVLDEIEPAGTVTSIEVIEADGNASWDVVVGSDAGVSLHLTRTPTRGKVEFIGSASIDQPVGEFSLFDFDNDSFQDVLAWTDEEVALLPGRGAAGFVNFEGNLSEHTPSAPIVTCDFGDLDADGDLDLLTASSGEIRLLENDGGNALPWIDLTVISYDLGNPPFGVGASRVNNYGIGSQLEIKAGDAYRAQVVRRAFTHFGLDELPPPETVRITWTNGVPQNVIQPQTEQTISEPQSLITSCPYLYTWNGDRFVFVTDLLWAAPIGLPSPQGGMTPHRDWEYLKIPGEMLAEKDGRYVLQITEELWEAAYFDQVRLLAIDHPADVDIYSNEKVGPPSISEYYIHTAQEPLLPVAAENHAGDDLLPKISAEDDDYAQPHTEWHAQGYTHDSFLELDLGELQDPGRITLFLTGWMHPTDAAINTALQENPDLPGPRPPSILVPDAEGEWIEAVSYMGFPGGKTKTIAVDLSGIFPAEDYRLRIATSMQLYWDHIFFTVGEEQAEYRETDLELVSADLHFRGVSDRIFHPRNGPERYNYDRVTPIPRYAPMHGAFTRFGDVRELLTTADDLLVVLGCGDEMTLEFEVPAEPLPAGWTRDFIIHSIGWDKDANLHTIYGQTVEPMPYRNMSSYPYEPESFPDIPGYEAYLREYQTREFDDVYHRRALHLREEE
ncbi:MAG: hypothetical protein DWQ34_00425 [Planctomycetota bacterium]|nr:MAG: hypothetical protein DWQ29_21175 [Planctomycetota bacterium]REJ98485.1 MAG: hypothetical protein DWQ34_00425 [Planctomycetota bacterium]REK23601.1 MAG: hypothetical protein DWQ41_16300 [Planctomycetota bacterium]REK31174.1 MAG: hypothetical protein DWQ45_20230 [Planctomycetota bacterium]